MLKRKRRKNKGSGYGRGGNKCNKWGGGIGNELFEGTGYGDGAGNGNDNMTGRGRGHGNGEGDGLCCGSAHLGEYGKDGFGRGLRTGRGRRDETGYG